MMIANDLLIISYLILSRFSTIALKEDSLLDEILDLGDDNELTETSSLKNTQTDDDDWDARYFPDKPFLKHYPMFAEDDMISANSSCDDGQTKLTTDWDNSLFNYTCFNDIYAIDSKIQPIIHQDLIPKSFKASHLCTDYKLEYANVLTTFGNHRLVWPRYGEYKFVPKQRWLHNLEHGAIVMVYHPCAHPTIVNELRSLVANCLKQHIITPYDQLPKERPLALLSWGWYLSMNSLDKDLAVQFIREHAKRGAQNITSDGEYDYLLLQPAKLISDDDDSILCPNHSE